MTPAVFLERAGADPGWLQEWRSDWWLMIGFWVVLPVAWWAGIAAIVVWLW
jgi:hypothetical protein